MKQFMHRKPPGLKYQGGWILAAAQLAFAAYSALSSDKKEGQQRQRQSDLEGNQVRIANQQEGRASQAWQEYQQTYLPRERELVDSAFNSAESPEAAANRATADVRQAAAVSKESGLRDARRLGVNPNSGAYTALGVQQQLGEAGLEASARDRARRATRAENFSRQSNVVSMGRGLPSLAVNTSQLASNTYGGLADSARDAADMYGDLAGKGAAAAGEAAGRLGSEILDRWSNKKTGTGA